ncbi:YncE family protein [Paralcaligenes sp. KSB-10]|uniref:YncE family protein n=1 Tax=Paralcaligenes sp. KSB-10 TaxID=2901142 RepID=UPI001E5FA300|nr:YncE family protein [Paralcaligenes sp. KSB-10]UHL63203.1 YncE family protein [Paralcaligenes sp. KSB-10]
MTGRETLLLVEKCSHCISWYDIHTGERFRSLELGLYPHEFVTDSHNKVAWIGHYGVETSGHTGEGGHVLFQVDIASGALMRTIDLSPYNRLHGMQMDEQDRLYVLSEDKAVLLVLDEPLSDVGPKRATSSAGIKSHLFALARDGRTAYCMNLLSHTVAKVFPWDPLASAVLCAPGQKPEGYCLSEDEGTLYVTNRWSGTLAAIDTRTMRVKYTAASREDPTRINLFRDGRLFISNYGDRSLSIVGQSDLREIGYVRLEARAIAVSFHPTRPIAFISQDDDRVAVLDTDSLSFLSFISTQREPDVSKVVFI